MNKKIGIVCFILTILLIIYINFLSLLNVVWLSIGGIILYYVPGLPVNDVYAGEATFIPTVLLFLYTFISGIYFIRLGWRKIKCLKN